MPCRKKMGPRIKGGVFGITGGDLGGRGPGTATDAPVGGKVEIGSGRVDGRKIGGKGSLGNLEPEGSDRDAG